MSMTRESECQNRADRRHHDSNQLIRLRRESKQLLGCLPPDVEQGVSAADWVSISRHMIATGDQNPLYLDPVYGARSWWSTQLAPPGFLLSILVPRSVGAGDRCDVDVADRLTRLELWWTDHIRLGEPVSVAAHLAHVGEIRSGRGLDALEMVTSARYRSGGREVGSARGYVSVRPLAPARETADARPIHRYTDGEIEQLIGDLEAEAGCRGPVPRFFGETAVGDALPTVRRGPITWSELQSWMVAEGRPAPAGNLRHRALLDRPGRVRPHAATAWPVSDRFQARIDLSSCRDVGYPAPAGRGAMLVALAIQYLTTWMGDGAFLRHIAADLPAPALYGDTLTFNARVIAKFEQPIGTGTFFCVAIEVDAVNQSGETVLHAHSLLYLPEPGLPIVPPIAAETF